MTIEQTALDGVLLFTPRIFEDKRGYFLESYNPTIAEAISHSFVQDNLSVSAKHVLRGLHYQEPPHAQGKLVQVLSGSVLDVIVDIRPSSSTFGQHIKVVIDAKRRQSIWIPPGFAHGFLALEDQTTFYYKCTALYNPLSEKALRYNDPDLRIDWGINNPLVSEKDLKAEYFRDTLK